MGLVKPREPADLWELATLLVADRFCSELKLGQLPEILVYHAPHFPSGGIEALFRQFCIQGVDAGLRSWYQELTDGHFFTQINEPAPRWGQKNDWTEQFASGITRSVTEVIESVSGSTTISKINYNSAAQRAKRQMMDYYPLLGALAASFDIEEDPRVCQQYDIRVAAVDVGIRRIYVNPAAGLSQKECLFVFAHELLHAGLNHASRTRGRDALLWNIACDFVINAWLIDMAVGTAPQMGLLYDPKFDGWSAEEVYDDLATDIRRAKKLATLRGVGASDILSQDTGSPFTDAEAYCRRALAQGLDRCMVSHQRGMIPAGLIEEIHSLSQPAIPWDVKLAEWFDERFPPPELHRTYARPSRRQGATPDTPRPSIRKPSEELRRSRVFGVILDTSGSMEPKLLGKALGAIASYSLARDVSAVRLVCCDAAPYDIGWVEPERLIERFDIKGRGGTILQPGINILEVAALKQDFPQNGPLLIITDGYCENRLMVRMDHAYLMPTHNQLPFHTKAPIFRVE